MHAGEEEYWVMFKRAYTAAVRYYKVGPWYINSDIWRGLPTQQQATSLQAFWPGICHAGTPEIYICGLMQILQAPTVDLEQHS